MVSHMKMKQKNAILISIILLFTVFISGCGMEYEQNVMVGYYKSDKYMEGFRSYTDYCKYYYKESGDKEYENNKLYKKMDRSNVETVRGYFEEFPYENMSDSDKYDIDTNCITEGDYYYLIYNNDPLDYVYTLYFYDKDEHILYYIHSS